MRKEEGHMWKRVNEAWRNRLIDAMCARKEEGRDSFEAAMDTVWTRVILSQDGYHDRIMLRATARGR